MEINDATISKIEYTDQGIVLHFLDWREQIQKICFVDAVFINATSPINLEFNLHEVSDLKNSSYVDLFSKLEEDIHEYSCFQLLSTWDDDIIVEIFAKSVVNI